MVRKKSSKSTYNLVHKPKCIKLIQRHHRYKTLKQHRHF